MNAETQKDVWEMIEEAPDYAEATADLYHWSTNFEAGQGPFTLFLDLIGFTADNMGESLYSLEDASLGYLEIGKLAAALTEYANRPQDVRAFADELVEAELSS